MDIGLEKLIEMIEQRLGKPAANALLGLIVLTVISVCLNLIWKDLLEPSWHALAAVSQWIVAKLSDVPVPKISPSLAAGEAILGAAVIFIAGLVILALGRVTRLIIRDMSLARDIRGNAATIWSDEKSADAVEKAWRRTD
jgi:hypothetical protein